MRPLRRSCLPLALLVACGGSPATVPAPPTARIDTIGTVEHVTSDRALGWADTSGWKLVEERVIDPAEGSEGQIGTVEGLALAGDGTVYVMQRAPARVLVFGPDGAFRRVIGREGDGPGDIHTGRLGLLGDTLLIQQSGNSRLTGFRIDGTHLFDVPSTCCDHGRSPLMVDSAGRIWIPGLPRDTIRAGAALTIGMRLNQWSMMNAAGRRLAVILMPTDTTLRNQKIWRGSIAIEGQRAAAAMVVPLQPVLRGAPQRNGLVVSGRTDQASLLVTGGKDDSVRVIHLPFPPRPVTDADRDTLLARYVPAESPFRGTAKREDIGPTWPRWTAIAIDAADRIWLGLPGRGREIDRAAVLDARGAFLGEVVIPGDAFFEGAWNGSRIAIRSEDGDGRPVVRIFRLVGP